jgi:TonB family protein
MRLLRTTALVFCLGTGLLAQSTPVTSPDASALFKDMVRVHVSPNQSVMALWYPFEMMAAAAKLQSPAATDEMMESVAGFMRGYAVFMVQASHKDAEGRETFLSEAEISAIASVTDNNGHVLRRVSDPPPNLATALAMAKAGFRTQPNSEHLELVVFDNKDAEGAFILQPMRPGGFALQLRSGSGMKALSLDWETPLPSVAGVTRCARCGAALSPGWHFCPICGVAVPKPPESRDVTPRPALGAPIRAGGDSVPPVTSTTPYKPGSPSAVGLTLPRLVREVKPAYTRAALDKRIEGTVVLDCVVREDGKVGGCQVTRSLDPELGLDQEAIKAARQWLFRPGEKNGVPVPVLVTIELTFTLRAK